MTTGLPIVLREFENGRNDERDIMQLVGHGAAIVVRVLAKAAGALAPGASAGGDRLGCVHE
jgi:hypothetical protein